MPTPETIAVIGAGHAAGQVVAALLHHDYAGRIRLIGEEPYLPYQRPPLSKKFLAGALPPERLYFKPADFYAAPRTELQLECRIERVDRERRIAVAADGRTFAWDALVLATGAHARRLPLAGSELAGVHYLRTIDDVRAIRADIDAGRRLVVIGGGYIGLEVAAVANTLGQDVTVIEATERVMSRVVSAPVSRYYEDLHRRHGVELLLESRIVALTGEGRVDGVQLADGRHVAADTVVIGIGIEPNVGLAADAGLAVDDGIVVDAQCRTEDAAIFAVGDCTSHPSGVFERHVRLESVHNALEQAKTAAANLCGLEARYDQVPWFWSDQYDVKLQIAGLSQGHDTAVVRGDPGSGAFSCVYLRDGAIVAVDAINRPRDFVQAKALIAAHTAIAPERLGDADRDLKSLAEGA